MRKLSLLLLAAAIGCLAGTAPVPASCTPQVNAKLAELISSGVQSYVMDVMVCGTTTKPSRYQAGRTHGSHHVHSVSARFPDGSTHLVEVVTNDDLDGVITSPAQAQLFAYGRAFFQNTRPYDAGLDETHCATHGGQDDGWIVINGDKHPASCASRRRRR